MCITLEPATLASTRLLAHQVEHEGRQVNVVGYQNSATNLSSGPNAMVLPIPSASPMTQANCIDMTGTKDLFREYEKLLRPRSRGGTKSLSLGAAPAGIEVFDSGSYTVLLTKQFDLEQLRDVLASLPAGKRLDLTLPKAKVFDSFRKFYPDWHLAICVWDGEIEAEPILWWYDPMPGYEDKHFLPGLDAHDGNPPDPGLKSVPVDHTLIVGTVPRYGYSNAGDLVGSLPAHLRKWVPSHVEGVLLHNKQARNGDWVLPKNFDGASALGGKRVPPPGYSGT